MTDGSVKRLRHCHIDAVAQRRDRHFGHQRPNDDTTDVEFLAEGLYAHRPLLGIREFFLQYVDMSTLNTADDARSGGIVNVSAVRK